MCLFFICYLIRCKSAWVVLMKSLTFEWLINPAVLWIQLKGGPNLEYPATYPHITQSLTGLSIEKKKGAFLHSLRKYPKFCDETTGFSTKWCLRNVSTKIPHLWLVSILTSNPDLGSVSNWLKQISLMAHPSGSDMSSVWSISAHSSEVVERGNWRWHLKMSAVFLMPFLFNVPASREIQWYGK